MNVQSLRCTWCPADDCIELTLSTPGLGKDGGGGGRILPTAPLNLNNFILLYLSKRPETYGNLSENKFMSSVTIHRL